MNAATPSGPVPFAAALAARPALFRSVRSSRDYALATFCGGLLVAFALHAGAFLPRLDASEPPARSPAVEQGTKAPAPSVMARRAPAVHGETPAAPAAEPAAPCPAPRG
jgi:hypothetical protein